MYQQLTSLDQFKEENIVFSKPEIGNIPGQKINFKRIRIAVKYPDNNIGDLIIATPPQLMCFGLQENRDLNSNMINGYSLPICLWNRNGPTDEEKQFTDSFDKITEYCKKYLIEHKEEIEKYDLDMSDLKKFNPLYWKMEKGKIVENKGPMLYAKAILNKKTNTINTIFVNEETNEETEPMDLLNKQCYVTAAIKFESIFIGNKISLQIKLFEVVFKLKDNTIRGLLRPNALKKNTDEINEMLEEEDEEFISSDSIKKEVNTDIASYPSYSSYDNDKNIKGQIYEDDEDEKGSILEDDLEKETSHLFSHRVEFNNNGESIIDPKKGDIFKVETMNSPPKIVNENKATIAVSEIKPDTTKKKTTSKKVTVKK